LDTLTPYQIQMLRAYAKHGSLKIAAYHLNLKEQSLRNSLSQIYLKLGVDNFIGAISRLGWLTVPQDYDDDSQSASMENDIMVSPMPESASAILSVQGS